eukprot:TRINITY_DN3006_c1_g1_i1.p4 TRINITY_DN3006_c1_g1~~TRINITY_DN3006_c1_g1_i1.p4  ORF type:complete len:177 (-),score=50.52 TRINITY_DN3006_c1_g1_i1:336-866(-)
MRPETGSSPSCRASWNAPWDGSLAHARQDLGVRIRQKGARLPSQGAFQLALHDGEEPVSGLMLRFQGRLQAELVHGLGHPQPVVGRQLADDLGQGSGRLVLGCAHGASGVAFLSGSSVLNHIGTAVATGPGAASRAGFPVIPVTPFLFFRSDGMRRLKQIVKLSCFSCIMGSGQPR